MALMVIARLPRVPTKDLYCFGDRASVPPVAAASSMVVVRWLVECVVFCTWAFPVIKWLRDYVLIHPTCRREGPILYGRKAEGSCGWWRCLGSFRVGAV